MASKQSGDPKGPCMPPGFMGMGMGPLQGLPVAVQAQLAQMRQLAAS